MTPHVWIVEIWEGERWVPTEGCSLKYTSAYHYCYNWRKNNPDGRFRVRKYVAAMKTRGRKR